MAGVSSNPFVLPQVVDPFKPDNNWLQSDLRLTETPLTAKNPFEAFTPQPAPTVGRGALDQALFIQQKSPGIPVFNQIISTNAKSMMFKPNAAEKFESQEKGQSQVVDEGDGLSGTFLSGPPSPPVKAKPFTQVMFQMYEKQAMFLKFPEPPPQQQYSGF